jgi:hypothetical protein
MNRIAFGLLVCASLGIQQAFADQYTPYTHIAEIIDGGTFDGMFVRTVVPYSQSSCGNYDWYILVDDGAAPYKTKSAAILDAFVSDKEIKLGLGDSTSAPFPSVADPSMTSCEKSYRRIASILIKP